MDDLAEIQPKNPGQVEPPGQNQTILETLESRSRILPGGLKEYGLFSKSGAPILESPTPDLINNFINNPKVEYFSFEIPSEDSSHFPIEDEEIKFIEENSHRGMGEFIFDRLVLRRLFEKVKAEQLNKGKKIALRGAACSIGGNIDVNGCRVLDVSEVLKLGDEQGRELSLGSILDPDSDYVQFNRSWQWLIQSAQEVRKMLKDHQAEAKRVFPILIVYDADFYERHRTLQGAVEKIYVVDYAPHRKKH